MAQDSFQISGKIVDVLNSRIYAGEITVSDGIINSIKEKPVKDNQYILPGFIDSHVHIESSMMVPSEFARIAVTHGTVAAVADPHEIANVLGVEGIDYMIRNAGTVPFHFVFGAPSCVPATEFETSGAVLDSESVRSLLQRKDIHYLSEVMNFPGVINKDPEVMAKITHAKSLGKKIDGHAPGLSGKDLKKYCTAGITTDHESSKIEEAEEKIKEGIKIQIREGSAARNFNELFPLIDRFPDSCMFCSDDKHPDELLKGHLYQSVMRAVKKGADVMNVLRSACVNPVLHYDLNIGLLRKGDPADFIAVEDLSKFQVLSTYIRGICAAGSGKSKIVSKKPDAINRFNAKKKSLSDFTVRDKGGRINIIKVTDGQLTTLKRVSVPLVEDGHLISDVKKDILKIAVINRYEDRPPAIGFVNGFGLKQGAIASTVAHDSHNIIAVGTDDEMLARAVNTVIQSKGGISVVGIDCSGFLGLPIGGIMSDMDAKFVADDYQRLDKLAKGLGSRLRAPFMTLSFLALPVIPSLRLTDRGLFDAERFEFVDLFEDKKSK